VVAPRSLQHALKQPVQSSTTAPAAGGSIGHRTVSREERARTATPCFAGVERCRIFDYARTCRIRPYTPDRTFAPISLVAPGAFRRSSRNPVRSRDEPKEFHRPPAREFRTSTRSLVFGPRAPSSSPPSLNLFPTRLRRSGPRHSTLQGSAAGAHRHRGRPNRLHYRDHWPPTHRQHQGRVALKTFGNFVRRQPHRRHARMFPCSIAEAGRPFRPTTSAAWVGTTPRRPGNLARDLRAPLARSQRHAASTGRAVYSRWA